MNDIELSRRSATCCATGSASTAQRPSTSNWSSLTPNFRRLYRQELGPLFYNAGIEEAIRTHQAWSERIRRDGFEKVY